MVERHGTRETQPLMRIPDVARRLGYSRSSVYRLINRGELPAVRIGSSIRVDADELEQYVYGEPARGGIPGPEDGRSTPRSGISLSDVQRSS